MSERIHARTIFGRESDVPRRMGSAYGWISRFEDAISRPSSCALSSLLRLVDRRYVPQRDQLQQALPESTLINQFPLVLYHTRRQSIPSQLKVG